MRKIVAGINMTLDGFCDHTAVDPDDEIHQYFTDLINDSGTILYGRITYGLMQFWQTIKENPSGEKSMNDFAAAIDQIPKIVFSNTLKNAEWDSAQLANQPLDELVNELKKLPGKDILVGSRSLIIQLMNLNLIDEYQFCVHPVLAGGGLPLFENNSDRFLLQLIKTKTFKSGAIVLYYAPTNEK